MLECIYCKDSFGKNNIKRHEKSCSMNPINQKICVVCGDPFKSTNSGKKGREQVTCSYSCSNKHFRSGKNNGNWNEDSYRTTCFLYHKKQCVICGENKIVAVHHFDENHKNNRPENLIPMCPTHHQYMHSKYKCDLIEKVEDYIRNRR